MQARQGDIFFELIDTIPASCVEVKDKIIAHGEVTGHKHTTNATLLLDQSSNEMFVSSQNDFLIKHDEHDNIPLKAGNYKVVRQREYDPISDAKERLVKD